MNILRLVAAVFLAALAAVPAAAGDSVAQIEITNLRYGLVCGPDDNMRVCFQAADIPITGEGHCIFDHKPIACTWYGLSFDFKLAGDEAELHCHYTSNVGMNLGNPNGRSGDNVTSNDFTFTLKTADGPHYFNPQYLSYPEAHDGSTQELHEVCRFGDQVVYDILFKLHMPEI
jgi:hypothetical protein